MTAAASPAVLKSEDQMVGISIAMRLVTFKKLKLAAGDDMLGWSNYIARLIERADKS